MFAYLLDLLIVAGTLCAAVLLGNRFLVEVRKARDENAPWYTPYLTLPGILILIALSLPILYWLMTR